MTSRSAPPLRWLACLIMLLGALAAGGCRSTGAKGLPPGIEGLAVPERYVPHIDAMRAGGERNWVLHLNEMAVEAMRNGDRELAERALDESILNINNVFGTTDDARKARNLFFNEDSKLYKGDPYERVMAFFYRGVLYMQRGDWGNARACFRSAALQDAFAEEEQFRADWTTMDFLVGVCELQFGRDRMPVARESFERATTNWVEYRRIAYGKNRGRGLLKKEDMVPFTADTNLLVLVQSGVAPRKVRRGDYGQFLGYRPGTSMPSRATVKTCEEKPQVATVLDSLYYQATTRGGRPFDTINRRKVIFKETTDTIGQIGTGVGAVMLVMSDSQQDVVTALAVIAASLLIRGVAYLVSTRADIRTWSNLPEVLAAHASAVCAGPTPIQVTYDTNRWVRSTINVPKPGEGLAVVLVFPGITPTILGPAGPPAAAPGLPVSAPVAAPANPAP